MGADLIQYKFLHTVEKQLNYKFRDKNLLVIALTHRSFRHECKDVNWDNERLEFLGDSVIQYVVSRILFDKFPNLDQGELSRARAFIVRRRTLAEVAKTLNLDSYLLLGKGEETTGGRKKSSVLSDAFEAVIGAIHVDGGPQQAANVLLRLLKPYIEMPQEELVKMDPKGLLQKFAHKSGIHDINYKVEGQTIVQGKPCFHIALVLQGRKIATGNGSSKKQASEAAALAALKKLGWVGQIAASKTSEICANEAVPKNLISNKQTE